MRRWIIALALLALASSASAALPALVVDGDDGKVALQLSAVAIRITVRGHLARTEYELTYHSSLNRVTGGDFYCPLPVDAEVSDLGLWFDGHLRHGVAVERVLARRAYDEVVHHAADPALAEWSAGRGFHLNVYPIPANGDKKVLIAYDQELTSGDYVLDVPDRKKIPSFDVKIDSDGATASDEGGTIRIARERQETAFTARSPEDGMWYASAALDFHPAAREVAPASQVVILYDTSASSIKQNGALLRRFLTGFLARQQAWSTATVLPFAIDIDEPRAIESAGTPAGARALERVLDDLQPLGATNLMAATARLAALAAELPPTARIVLVTDGLTSLGNSRDVAAAVANLSGARRPVLVVQAAPNADDRLLANAARATGGWSIDLNRVDPEAAIETAMHQPLSVKLSGSEVVPEAVLASSDARFAVAARGKDPFTVFPVREIPLRELHSQVESSMIRRAWARAKLREMLAHGAPDDDLIAHGLAFTELTPRTSLLVLETWWDYERYGIPLPPDVAVEKQRYEEEQRLISAARQDLPPSPIVTPGGWSMTGRVLMSEGLPVPGVTVILKDGESAICAVVTDGDGRFYVAASAAPKEPRIIAELEGFDAAVRAFNGSVPADSSVDITMHLAAVAESITVTAAAPVVETPAAVAANMAPSLREDGAATTDSEELTDEEALAGIAQERRALRMRVIERLRAIGSTSERIRYYLSARSLLGGDKGFHVYAAEVFRERSPEVAPRILSDLAEARPDDAPLLRILARVLDGWGEESLARLLLERAIEVSPTEPQSWREMILLEARHGNARGVAAWSRRMTAGKHRDWMDAVYEQTSDALKRWEKASFLDRQRGVDVRSAADDDLTIELMFDTGWSWVDIHVVEPSGEEVTWNHPESAAGATFTGGYTFGFGPEIYTLHKAPPGRYRVAIDYYASDQTNVSLETLVHVIIRERGPRGTIEQREKFVVLSEDKENLLLATVKRE